MDVARKRAAVHRSDLSVDAWEVLEASLRLGWLCAGAAVSVMVAGGRPSVVAVRVMLPEDAVAAEDGDGMAFVEFAFVGLEGIVVEEVAVVYGDDLSGARWRNGCGFRCRG